jgi:hypothetical protein
MITIEINKHQYEIPTQWNEVTLKQYIEISENVDELNHVRLLSILTGIEFDTLNNFPCDAFQELAIPEMNWIGEPFKPQHHIRPTSIKLGGKEIKTIQDVGQERFGQKLFMQQLVNKGIAESISHVNLVAPVLACYYAPFLHPEKKWVESHVKEVEQMIYNLPVYDAWSEADFFLSGYIKYKPKKPTF